jgi:hypothetical protein
MCLYGFEQEGKHRATLLDTGGRYGPKPLAPVLPLLAPGSLGHSPVHSYEAKRLFRQVVRRVHGGFGDETEIAIRVASLRGKGRSPHLLPHGPLRQINA